MKSKTTLFVLLCCVTFGCYLGPDYNKEMAPWVGKLQSELIMSYGPPAATDSDGKGGRILTYYRRSVPTGMYTTIMMYWANEQGILYHYRWQRTKSTNLRPPGY